MPEEIKKFYRSRTDRVLFGVCGGLGKYFGIDPVLFRLLFILLFFMDGAGLVLYFIMLIITPEEPGRESGQEGTLKEEVNEFAQKLDRKAHEFSGATRIDENKMKDSRNLLGGIIIVFGLFFLVRQFFPIPWMDTNIIWALVVIGIGLYIIFKR